MGRTCCVQRLFLTFRTIYVHSMFSPCSAKRRASDILLYISIKFSHHKQSENGRDLISTSPTFAAHFTTNRDSICTARDFLYLGVNLFNDQQGNQFIIILQGIYKLVDFVGKCLMKLYSKSCLRPSK